MTDATGGASGPAMTLTAEQLEATLQPLERATMLPPAAFLDRSLLEWELRNVFAGGWICAGHASAVAEPGAFLSREVGEQSFFVVGGEDGVPRAFHNVCRHRASRLLEQAEGQVRRRLQCPYHAWSYDLEGNLRAAPHMDGVEGFDPQCSGLVEIACAVVGGLVLVDLSGASGGPAEEHVGDLLPHLERYSNARLRRAGIHSYQVAANWKGIAENYNECLHCPGVHPELNALSNYMSGEGLYGKGAWCGGSMTLTGEGAETMGTGGGHAASRPPIATLEEADLANILYFALFPNALVSLHPDYVMVHTLWPREPGRTEVHCEFFFEPETIARPDFDPADAVGFWDQVNREDWHVCELAQKGVSSAGYSPGRYSAEESDVHAFDAMVAAHYYEGLREVVA
ncbi:MAG TPA: aromatic ring-hydroxylating dioxygenase subunit alpha [Solirubrobacterales bacterium]